MKEKIINIGGSEMANDLFGNLSGTLGGIMGGLAKSGLVPKDTPEGKLLVAQTELADLQKQENEILQEIGRQAYAQNPAVWAEDTKLKLIQQNIAAAQAVLNEAKQEQEQAEAAQAAEDAIGKCPSCGYKNPEGVNFCQECGSKLGSSFCVSCGAMLAPGTRFCGECGARQMD